MSLCTQGGRGSSVGRARDSWWGGPRFDSRCGRPLPAGWVGVSISAKLNQSRTARMARRNTCFLSQPMDATAQHCPATMPAVTGIDRPKLGQHRSSGHTVHTTDKARTALRLSKLRSIKILYTLTMIYDSSYI